MANNNELSLDSFVESLKIDNQNDKPKTCFDIVKIEKEAMVASRKKGVSYEVLAKYIAKKYKVKITVATLKKYLSNPKDKKLNIESYDLEAKEKLFFAVVKSLNADGVPISKLINFLSALNKPIVKEEVNTDQKTNNFTELKTY
jgi:uncharacterized membrane protein